VEQASGYQRFQHDVDMSSWALQATREFPDGWAFLSSVSVSRNQNQQPAQ
jgi:hypothetical protein